jgi:hypothetical protein
MCEYAALLPYIFSKILHHILSVINAVVLYIIIVL